MVKHTIQKGKRWRIIAALRVVPLIALIAVCGTSIARADTDSTQSQVSIVKSGQVLITDIEDWFIGAFPATHSLSSRERATWDYVCVHSTTGLYNITLQSSNTGTTRLNLVSASGDTMRYNIRVIYRNENGNTRRSTVRNATTTFSRLQGSTLLDCADQPNFSNIRFRPMVGANAFNAAPPGIYTDLMQLTVSPE